MARITSKEEIALRKQMQELIIYFNSPEGYSAFGWHGDEQGWPPERTAIEGLRECVRLRQLLADERERCAKIASNMGTSPQENLDPFGSDKEWYASFEKRISMAILNSAKFPPTKT